MICKKYKDKYSFFQVIIPGWIVNEVLDNNKFKNDILKKCKYENISLNTGDDVVFLKGKESKRSHLIFRGDILPKPREIFISLMKDSINDILVTGDQSLSDIISCCNYKKVWYQIAPWKKGLAENLTKHLPNKYYDTFKTSCGTLKGINTKIDWKNFMSKYDFRINGKKRMNAILIANYHFDKSNDLKSLLNIINTSRFLDTAQKKINKL